MIPNTFPQRFLRYTLIIIPFIAVFLLLGYCLQRTLAIRNRGTCLDNLHRVGVALRQYVADNDEVWPTETVWIQRKLTTTALMGCPSAPSPPKLDPPLANPDAGLPGYAINTGICSSNIITSDGSYSFWPMRTSQIIYPQNTIAVLDYISGVPATGALNPYPPTTDFPNVLERGWLRHGGGGNYLFCDGHAKWHAETQIYVPKVDTCQNVLKQPSFCRN